MRLCLERQRLKLFQAADDILIPDLATERWLRMYL